VKKPFYSPLRRRFILAGSLVLTLFLGALVLALGSIQAHRTIGVHWGIALGTGILIFFLISFWIARRTIRPLIKKTAASMESPLEHPALNISDGNRDGLALLAAHFPLMLQQIVFRKKKLEEALQEIRREHRYLVNVLDTMEDGLLAFDMDVRVTMLNPAARQILDIPDDQAVHLKSVWDLVDPVSPVAAYIREILADPSAEKQRVLAPPAGKNGPVILVNAGRLDIQDTSPRSKGPRNKTPRNKTPGNQDLGNQDPGNTKIGEKEPWEIVLSLTDVTAVRSMGNRALDHQPRADLERLAAGMAHEIRNPLSAIKSFVALLPKNLEKPGFLEKFQQTVPREINRLNTVIEEMLELSRPPRYIRKPTDIRVLVAHCRALLEKDFNQRNIFFQVDLPDDSGWVDAETHLLEKAVVTLLQNGARSMPRGGTIRISVSCSQDHVTLAFSDTGHGIAPDMVKGFFDPFFTARAKGSGLGLAIAHKVITGHGGRVRVDSREGEGTCFTVRLPKIDVPRLPPRSDPRSDSGS
jgi:two-component system sensor histidine kinase AtoS